MVYTRTKTKTHVYTISEELAKFDPILEELREKINEIQQDENFKKKLSNAGIELEETSDPSKLEIMRNQWETVLPPYAGIDTTEINEIFAKYDKKEQQESRQEFDYR